MTIELLLAERTEQCAKIAETMELPLLLKYPGDLAVEVDKFGASIGLKIRALNQPETKS